MISLVVIPLVMMMVVVSLVSWLLLLWLLLVGLSGFCGVLSGLSRLTFVIPKQSIRTYGCGI